MALYESDHTKFMRELLAKHPDWAEDRLTGRALLWDRPIDLDEQKVWSEAAVPARPYAYDLQHKPG